MAGKRIKATTKPDKKLKKSELLQKPGEGNLEFADRKIKAIIEKGKKQGYLTYEEMNADLPEDVINPAKLDRLLATLDEMGVRLLDESDVPTAADEDFEADGFAALGNADEQIKEDELLEKQLVGSESRRIDDPIRMYLTQMGEIPLLTRDEEIALARKIELARMAFRRRMLESDYCASNCVEILHQVDDGALSFDRTMKISTSENLIRSVIKKRMPDNLKTVEVLLDMNRNMFTKTSNGQNTPQAKSMMQRILRNKRKIATLLEELSLRTSRIQPMKSKLHGICNKMFQWKILR